MLRRLFPGIPTPAEAERDTLLAHAVPGFDRYRLARDRDGRPVLLVRADPPGQEESQAHLRLRQISLRPNARCRIKAGGTVGEESLTIVQCETTAPEAVSLFLEVMGAWIQTMGQAPTRDAVITSFSRLARMFECLAMPSRSDVRGAWGELFIAAVAEDSARALRAWHRGPSETYDFTEETCAVEAKTCHGPAHSHIFSLSQLTHELATTAVVVSLILVDDVEGVSLSDLLELLADRMSDPRLHLRAVEIVAELLGSSWQQVENARFDARAALRSLRLYAVTSIPRIDPVTIPSEVSEVKFRVDLSSLSPLDAGLLRLEGTLRAAMVPGLSSSQLDLALGRIRGT